MLNLVLCFVVYTCFVFYCISAVLRDSCWFGCSVMTATIINEDYYYYYYYVFGVTLNFTQQLAQYMAVLFVRAAGSGKLQTLTRWARTESLNLSKRGRSISFAVYMPIPRPLPVQLWSVFEHGQERIWLWQTDGPRRQRILEHRRRILICGLLRSAIPRAVGGIMATAE